MTVYNKSTASYQEKIKLSIAILIVFEIPAYTWLYLEPELDAGMAGADVPGGVFHPGVDPDPELDPGFLGLVFLVVFLGLGFPPRLRVLRLVFLNLRERAIYNIFRFFRVATTSYPTLTREPVVWITEI